MLVSDSIEKAHCVAGVITNSILLYCIRRHTRTSLGAYRQLLTVFASFDLFLTILHGVIEPKIVIVNATFGVVSGCGYEDRRLASFYCACFSVPFTLMNIHFLYRYWTVSRPHLIPLFSSTPFIIFLVSIPAGGCVLWYFLCIYGLSGDVYDASVELLRSEFEHRNGVNLTKGWIVMDWDNPLEISRLLATLVMYDTVISVSLFLAVTLGILTFIGIRRKMKMSSRKTIHFELRLLISVTAQTAIPIVFVYIPYFCCLTFTALRVPVHLFEQLCFFLTSCFPAWDAVIVILLMTDYRRAVVGMISKLKPPTLSSVSQMTVMK